MDANELRELTIDELNTKIDEFSKELFDVRFQIATHQANQTAEIARLKKTIARAKTILREKELASQS